MQRASSDPADHAAAFFGVKLRLDAERDRSLFHVLIATAAAVRTSACDNKKMDGGV